MKTKVEWSEQVESFVLGLAPAPRRRLRLAILGLAGGKGDIKQLQGELSGYSRLRVTHFRVVYREGVEKGCRVVRCLYANERSVVYELFAQVFLDKLGRY